MGQQTFRTVSRDGLAWLEAVAGARWPWLVHAFSTRCGGASQAPCAGLNLGFTQWDKRETVEANRRHFWSALGVADFAIASVHQVHSSHGFVTSRARTGDAAYRLPCATGDEDASTKSPAGDALMTAEPGILLTIRIADCLPVLLIDPARPAVAAVHAGWRGALDLVVEKAVGDMRVVFGSDSGQIVALVGPSIRPCCYDVGEEVVEAFRGRFPRADQFFQALPQTSQAAADRYEFLFLKAYPPGHAPERVPAARLDLTAVAQDQLASAGVNPSNILVADYCTACHTDLFFSHRKEGVRTGRQVAAIGIRPQQSD